MKALAWTVGVALLLWVAVLADGWSLPGRFWLAFLVCGVPYLIADSERQRR